MNEQFKNNSDQDAVARKLSQVAEQTHANGQFAAELEEQLRRAHQPKAGWVLPFAQISPTLRWVALMALLALVLSLSIRTLIPAPQPANDNTPVALENTPTPAPDVLPDENATPVTETGGYNFRGGTLFLQQPLPASPSTAHVYQRIEDPLATMEQARALADRFGIQGEMYTAPGLVYGTTDYVVSDGRQFLQVHTANYFTYTADMARNNRSHPVPNNPNAETIIREFLTSHGFDFPFRLSASEYVGGYVIQPLAPDSIPLQYESFSQPMMRVVLDENGQVLTVNAILLNQDPNPLGEYGIISAQEAFDKLLDEMDATGKMEFFHSPTNTPQQWYREYPDGQTLTVFGNVTASPSTDPGKPALVLLDGIPVIGNITGLENVDYFTFVKATGQFFVENGLRKFNVESWETNVELLYLSGTLHREGDRVIFTTDDGSGTQYTLVEPPADLPVDVDPSVADPAVVISGIVENDQFEWNYIQYFEALSGGGGGGGGGGAGFYQLNLSGTPVAFPTALPELSQPPVEYIVQEGDTLAAIAMNYNVSIEELKRINDLNENAVIFVGQKLIISTPVFPDLSSMIGKRFENQRGLFIFNNYRQEDGSLRKEYAFVMASVDEGTNYLILEGKGLESLEKYHNRPVNIWATVESVSPVNEVKARVDRFEIPFPDLQFQILKGVQKMQEVDGRRLLTFVDENGTTYFQRDIIGEVQDERFLFAEEGTELLIEALIIPDEPFNGYPTLRMFGTNHVVDPISGQTNEMVIGSDQPYVMDESDASSSYTAPDLTITEVELVYYTSNPFYQVNTPKADQRPPQIQPVWRFHGIYEDGTEFEILVQALRQEFLLPELAPAARPG